MFEHRSFIAVAKSLFKVITRIQDPKERTLGTMSGTVSSDFSVCSLLQRELSNVFGTILCSNELLEPQRTKPGIDFLLELFNLSSIADSWLARACVSGDKKPLEIAISYVSLREWFTIEIK